MTWIRKQWAALRQELRIVAQFWKYRAKFFADIVQRQRDAALFAEVKRLSKADQWVLRPSDLGGANAGYFARGDEKPQRPAIGADLFGGMKIRIPLKDVQA